MQPHATAPAAKGPCAPRIAGLARAALLAVLAAAPLTAQAPRPFTVDDALDVRTVAVAAASDDARHLVVTTRTARGRMGTDHFRFGDPTYIAPRLATVSIVDAVTGAAAPLFDGDEVNVTDAAWDVDGDRAVWLREVDGVPRVEFWDGERVRTVRPEAGFEPAWGEVHGWLPDGSAVVLGVRGRGWREDSRAAYLAMEEGPIVVQDSGDDFLSWDAVRMRGDLTHLAVLGVPSGDLRILTGEGVWSGVEIDPDGGHVSFTRVHPLRTSYTRGEGTEYTVLRMPLDGVGSATPPTGTGAEGPAFAAAVDTLLETSEERRRVSFSPDGAWYAWSDGGDVHLRGVSGSGGPGAGAGGDGAGPGAAADADDEGAPPAFTAGLRTPLSAADSTERRLSLQGWAPDGSALLLRGQDGYWVAEIPADYGADTPRDALPAPGRGATRILTFAGDTPEERAEGPDYGVERWAGDGFVYLTRSAIDRWERGLVRVPAEGGAEEVLVMDDRLRRSWIVADDGGRIVFRRSDGDRPDDLWVADAGFASPRALTEANPQLAEVAFAESELITYLDVDGNELHGVLYRPPAVARERASGGDRGGSGGADGGLPLVAEIYEDFFSNGYNSSAQILAAQGWVVLRPSVDFEIGFPGEAWMKGVTTAINDLIEDGLVDGDKLGVHGTSYGGYAANLLVTQTDRFAAAINISGKVNIISFLGDSEKITTRNYRAAEESQDRIGASLWEQPQKYVEHSAVMYADRIDTPLLLLTGQGDWNVPATNTREMYYALKRLGKEVVWVNYMRAGHGAGRAGTEADFRDHWRRIVEWYAEHFGEEEAAGVVSDGAGG
jgi:dipeptidyl aminopeptidase/acylaminoacyl peptidase